MVGDGDKNKISSWQLGPGIMGLMFFILFYFILCGCGENMCEYFFLVSLKDLLAINSL